MDSLPTDLYCENDGGKEEEEENQVDIIALTLIGMKANDPLKQNIAKKCFYKNYLNKYRHSSPNETYI
jgi:hypothetical protein